MQLSDQQQNYRPIDKSLKMVLSIGLFVVCTIVAALNEFRQGQYALGFCLLLPPLMVMGAQLVSQQAHGQLLASIRGERLLLRQPGGVETMLDLRTVSRLGSSRRQNGWREAQIVYWAETDQGDRRILFAQGTFLDEAELLDTIARITGFCWGEVRPTTSR